MEDIRHHGRRTAYRVSDRGGDGPPILAVHGSGSNHGVWRAQHRLADEWPFVAVDLSGHGDSEDIDTPPGPETLEAYVEDVVAVARETNAGVLCGNSLGGAVVLQLALEADLDPAALLLVGTGAKLGVRSDLLGWLGSDFDRAIEFLLGPNRLLAGGDDRYLSAAEESMRSAGQAVTERDFRTSHAFDVRDRLGEIRTPGLAVTGEHDELTPPAYHEYLAEELPAGEWTTISNAAHLSMLERPAAFNDAVRSFLSETGV
ncbi:MAG: alpha/beta fold hydrolase [Halobacteriales archaeon]